MTLIVALATLDNVVMGADTGTYDLDSGIREQSASPKIFRQHAVRSTENASAGDSLHFLVGCAGSARQRQVFQHQFMPYLPFKSRDLTGYMVTSYASDLHDALDDAHALSDDGGLEGSAVIAVYGTGRWNNAPRIYELQSDFGISEVADSWNATGASYEIALGAMAALDACGLAKESPGAAVGMVMDIASRYSLFCQPPFRTEYLIED